MWADEDNVLYEAKGNVVDVFQKWFETKVDEAWRHVIRIQQLMLIEEIQEPSGPVGYEGYVKLLARILRSRKAAKYNSLSDDVKFNMYVFCIIEKP